MTHPALLSGLALVFGLGGVAVAADAPVHDPHRHAGAVGHVAAPAASAGPLRDSRQRVEFPEPLRVQTLANMRDHLVVLGEVQLALSRGAFDKASELAERRLGMSSLETHGAHEVAQYMPAGMQSAGTAMHRAASQMAIVARDASVTGDLRPVLASLAALNQTCVACHAAYRLQ